MSEKSNNNKNLNTAVVLGLYYTGYGIIRELSEFGIDVYAFDRLKKWPESATCLAKKTFVDNDAELLDKLVEFAGSQALKPVMYLASDYYVNFYETHRDVLEKYYLIHFPSSQTSRILLNKGDFANFAKDNNYSIPKTFIINSMDDYDDIADNLVFPCVLKPYWRKENWTNAGFKKVYACDTPSQLKDLLEEIIPVESNLIVQENIMGRDRNVYFYLMYFDENSQCISDFEGRKLRQWPVNYGQTACAVPVKLPNHVKGECIRLFNQLKYKGFGSVEYKRHRRTGHFYIMEPTVGRQNAQSSIASANGIKMSVVAYSCLTGHSLDIQKASLKPVIWIDDQYDVFSIICSLFKRQLHYSDVLKSYFSKKYFRLWNKKDRRVAVYCWTIALYDKVLNRVERLTKNISLWSHSLDKKKKRKELMIRYEIPASDITVDQADRCDVSIIIVNWNTREITCDCLKSVYEQTHNVSYEVIVVDNASSDDSVEVIKRDFPQTVLIANSENRGFAAGNNQGMARANGKYTVLLNSDTVVLDRAIDKMFEVAERHPEAGIFGCKVFGKDRKVRSTCFMYPSLLNLILSALMLRRLLPGYSFFNRERMGGFDEDMEQNVSVVSGSFMFVRSDAIATVGRMDERFFMYAEETDWCRRFANNGWPILYTPKAEIIHLGGASTSKRTAKMAMQLHGSILLYLQKHNGQLMYMLACLIVCLYFLVRIPLWALRILVVPRDYKHSINNTIICIKGAFRSLLGAKALCQKR